MPCSKLIFPFVLWSAAVSLAAQKGQQSPMPLPLFFQANQGQMAPDVKYFALGHGYTLAFSRQEVRLSPDGAGAGVAIAFPVSKMARIEAEDLLPFQINSIKGTDRKGWISGAHAWSRVRYRQIQPGVDLVFHPAGNIGGGKPEWEFDFELAAGVDPSKIQFEVRGAAELTVDSSGDLVTRIQDGESIRWRKPVSWQKPAGGSRSIATAFVVSGKQVGFFLDQSKWDRNEALVIDPAFVFSTYFGGSGSEISRGIGRDSAGNIYICGSSSSGNLPTVRTSYQPNYKGGSVYNLGDAFVAKFTPAGGLSYVTYLGGSLDDVATALAVDSAGSVYLTGFTASEDFPILNGFQPYYGGSGGNSFFGEGGDAFVAKFTAAGTLSDSTYLGGSLDDAGLAIAVDAAGNAYVAGSTLSPNFPTAGGYKTTYGGTSPAFVNDNGYVAFHLGDAFVAKISPSGQQLVVATYLGGALDDAADAIALDGSGNVWVGGNTNSTNFPVVNPLQQTFGGNSPGSLQPVANLGDGFIAKLNPGLSSLLYSTFLGGSGDDAVTALAVDSGGSVYIAGLTLSSNFPTTTGVTFKGPTVLAPGLSAATGDAFVAKLSPSGKALTYGTLLGGSGNDFASSLAVDASGNAYIAGMTASTDFPLAGNHLQSTFGGAVSKDGVGHAFMAMFNPTGALLYSSYLGGNGQDLALGLVLDSANSAYITGYTGSSNFPIAAAYQSKLSSAIPGGYNAFLAEVLGLVSPPTGPAITSVTTAYAGSAIAQNTFIIIKGVNLVPATTPGSGVIWSTAPSFASGQMPTQLGGISVTVNNKPAFVYFYCSAATDPACAQDQLNILTPLDSTIGPVPVVVTSGSVSSPATTANMQAVAPSFLLFSVAGYIAATHADYSLLGPTSLYPGASTPAKPGEIIALYAVGFGLPTTPLVNGSAIQSGSLPALPICTVGGNTALVYFAGLISPGLYQLNLTVPAATPNGDQAVNCTYNGSATPVGDLITVHQ